MLIERIVDAIVDALFDDAVSGFRERQREKKVKEQIAAEISRVIEDEKDNAYYDVLDRVLSDTTVLQDYAYSLEKSLGTFDFDTRLHNLGEQMKLSDLERTYVIPVVKRLFQIIDGVFKGNLSKDTKYLLSTSENNTKTLEAEINSLRRAIDNANRIPLTIYPSHQIPDQNGIPLIKRHIIPMNQADYPEDSAILPTPIEYLKQEKKIVLLSDAGAGKSFTLYQMFREAESEHFQIVFYRLNDIDIEQNNALVALAKGDAFTDSLYGKKTIILLDGYDEMMKEDAHDRLIDLIQEIIKRFPAILILISSRSSTNYAPLENVGFVPYRIKTIDQADIDKYLDDNNVEKEAFYKQVEIQQLDSLCQNAFYLSEMVSLWRQEQLLPSASKLMDAIISKRISEDSDKYSYTSTSLKQHIRDTRDRFERISLIMQCMHQDYLTTEQLLRITGSEDRAILRYHGLWNKFNQDKWRFAHNNFREYFAAVALAKKDLDAIKGFICCGSDNQFIRASWHNTLSYLIAIDEKDDLPEWVLSVQPELLSLFEKDRFSTQKRSTLFIHLMEETKKDHRWLDTDYSYRQKLVIFTSSSETVRYILDELKKDIPIRQKQNLLRCLVFFDTYYEYQIDVNSIVFEIANDTTNPDYYRADAFRVMESQEKAFSNRTEAVADILCTATEESVRYGALLFLRSSGTAENHFNAVLIELDRCTKGHPVLLSLRKEVVRIANSITQESSAYALLTYYKDRIEHIYSGFDDDIFEHCCEVGAATYCGDDDRILRCLLEIVKTGYMLIPHENYRSIRQYMLNTHTVDVFLESILEEKIPYYRSTALYDVMSDEMVRELLDSLKSGQISISEISEIIRQFPYGDSWQTSIIESVKQRTGVQIEIDPPIDYEAKKARERQIFFDALFDEHAFSELGSKICAIVGYDTPICKEISFADADKLKQIHENKALSEWYYLIRSMVPDDSPLTFGEYWKIIGDWDEFSLYSVERVLKEHHENLIISDQQKGWLTQQATKALAKFDIKTAIEIKKGRVTYPLLLYVSLSIMQLLDVECDRDLAIQLLSVPSPILHEESQNQLPSYAVKWLDEQTIRSTIITNIHAGELNAFTAPAYAHYCTEHCITECKEDFIAYLVDKDRNDGFVYAEVEYIVKLFGEDVLLEEVLTHCNDDRLLEYIVTHIQFEKKSNELDSKLWDSYRNTKDTRWLKYLINRNNVSALEEYIRLCRECLASPDVIQRSIDAEVADAIRTVYKAECLDSVIKLLMIASDSRFVDDEEPGFGLSNSCWAAITNIAKSNYSLTIDALESNRYSGNDGFNDIVGDIIKRIKSNREFASDVALSFEAALFLTE